MHFVAALAFITCSISLYHVDELFMHDLRNASVYCLCYNQTSHNQASHVLWKCVQKTVQHSTLHSRSNITFFHVTSFDVFLSNSCFVGVNLHQLFPSVRNCCSKFIWNEIQSAWNKTSKIFCNVEHLFTIRFPNLCKVLISIFCELLTHMLDSLSHWPVFFVVSVILEMEGFIWKL